MQPVISEYTSSDKEGVKHIVLKGKKEFGFEYDPRLDSDLEDINKHYIEQGGMFYVLKVDNRIIGTVAVEAKDKYAELKRLYVAKEYQGKKCGSFLLDSAIQFCKASGFSKLELDSNVKFQKAHLLYRRRGFRLIKEVEGSYLMEKDL